MKPAGRYLLLVFVMVWMAGIARLTGTQSAFGAEFDSLADVISFGMAPSLLMFTWAFQPLGQLGWAASFMFVSCAALRLARYNIQLGTVNKRFFRTTKSSGCGNCDWYTLGRISLRV